MHSQDLISSTDITRRADIPRDVLTFWLRNGLLCPVEAPTGKGRHLRFKWYELNIAAIMNHLRITGLKIEGMLSIVATFREAIAWAESYDLNRDEVGALHTMFILHHQREQQYFDDAELARKIDEFSGEHQGPSRITGKVRALHAKMPKDEFYRHLNPFLTISEQPEPMDPREAVFDVGELTYFWRTGEGDTYQFEWGEAAAFQSQKSGARAMIGLDISTILWEVWNEKEDGISAMLERAHEDRKQSAGA